MSVRFRHEPGPPYGIVYLFERRGEGLPMHDHTLIPELEHDVLCLSGRVIVYGPKLAPCVLRGGEHFKLESSALHEIVALEDTSAVLNVFKRGMPTGYDRLPPQELEGLAQLGPVQLKLEGRR